MKACIHLGIILLQLYYYIEKMDEIEEISLI